VIIHPPIPQPVVNKVLKIARSKLEECLLSIDNVESSNILHPCNVTYSTDMIIKSNEKFIPLHKTLVSTIPKIKDLLDKSMTGTLPTLTFNQFDAEILLVYFKSYYYDFIDINTSTCFDLYTISEYFDDELVKGETLQYIKQNISKSNFLHAWKISTEFQDICLQMLSTENSELDISSSMLTDIVEMTLDEYQNFHNKVKPFLNEHQQLLIANTWLSKRDISKVDFVTKIDFSGIDKELLQIFYNDFIISGKVMNANDSAIVYEAIFGEKIKTFQDRLLEKFNETQKRNQEIKQLHRVENIMMRNKRKSTIDLGNLARASSPGKHQKVAVVDDVLKKNEMQNTILEMQAQITKLSSKLERKKRKHHHHHRHKHTKTGLSSPMVYEELLDTAQSSPETPKSARETSRSKIEKSEVNSNDGSSTIVHTEINREHSREEVIHKSIDNDRNTGFSTRLSTNQDYDSVRSGREEAYDDHVTDEDEIETDDS